MSVETILKERAEIFGESVEENIKRFDRLKAVDMKNFPAKERNMTNEQLKEFNGFMREEWD